MADSDPTSQPENPYAAPQATLSADAAVTEDPATRQLRAFVGPRAHVYLRKWAGDSGFNWPAFFFSGLWIAYRKMYRVTAIFFGAVLVISIAEEVLFVHILGEPEAPPALDHAVNLVLALVCGFSGNRWYLSHARRVIAEVRALGLPDDASIDMISRRGGTNLLAAIGILLLFMAVVFAVFFVLEFLRAAVAESG